MSHPPDPVLCDVGARKTSGRIASIRTRRMTWAAEYQSDREGPEDIRTLGRGAIAGDGRVLDRRAATRRQVQAAAVSRSVASLGAQGARDGLTVTPPRGMPLAAGRGSSRTAQAAEPSARQIAGDGVRGSRLWRAPPRAQPGERW